MNGNDDSCIPSDKQQDPCLSVYQIKFLNVLDFELEQAILEARD